MQDFFMSFKHYLNIQQILLMMLAAAVSIALCLWILYLSAKHMAKKNAAPEDRAAYMRLQSLNLAERFYELIISATLILLFVGIYFSIDYFGLYGSAGNLWRKYNGVFLLLVIFAAIVVNSIIDSKVIPLTFLLPGDQAAMRFIGMVYMLAIFVYIKFIYDDSNYDSIILYFITLVIGRFVYFDATLESFKATMKQVLQSIYLLFPALLCSGIIAYCGFSSGFLIRYNGVVLNLFIGHLFLLPVILVVNRGRIFQHILPKPEGSGKRVKNK